MIEWEPGPYQVGLSIDGNQLVSKHIAEAVSLALGGSGGVDLIDGCKTYIDSWMIDLPGPCDGEVTVVDECGFPRKVIIETPLP